MGLQINNQVECFQISGALNKTNVEEFTSYFEDVVENSSQITINIEELTSIDRTGVNALVKLYLKSLENNAQFFITGFGSKDIHEHLRTVGSAA